MPFRLQYASNLFVDLQRLSFPTILRPGCSRLALLGNIGRPDSLKTAHFLNYCASHWEKTYWLVGPHELTNKENGTAPYREKMEMLENLVKQYQGSIQLVNTKELVFPQHELILLATPLWTNIRLPSRNQPEFQSIYSSVDEAGPIRLTLNERNQWNKKDLEYLMSRTVLWNHTYPRITIVYLTHTLPTPLLMTTGLSEETWNRYTLDVQDYRGFLQPPIKAWLGGSTGTTNCIQVGSDPSRQVLCGVNSLYEYPYASTMEMKSSYDPKCILELFPKKPKHTSVKFPSNLLLPTIASSLLSKKVSLQQA
jgi:hypothetical protein